MFGGKRNGFFDRTDLDIFGVTGGTRFLPVPPII